MATIDQKEKVINEHLETINNLNEEVKVIIHTKELAQKGFTESKEKAEKQYKGLNDKHLSYVKTSEKSQKDETAKFNDEIKKANDKMTTSKMAVTSKDKEISTIKGEFENSKKELSKKAAELVCTKDGLSALTKDFEQCKNHCDQVQAHLDDEKIKYQVIEKELKGLKTESLDTKLLNE